MTTSLSDDRAARILLAAASEPGDEITGALIEAVGAVATVELIRSDADLPTVIGVAEGALWRRHLAARIHPDQAERMLEETARLRLTVITPNDPDWPSELRQLGPRAPIALWLNGAADRLNAPLAKRVAIVGARAATSYGEHVTAEIASDLAGHGRTVVSGGAYGIDGAAHRAAMAARPGATIAVVAAGVDRPYPAGHAQMFERIADHGGLIVSELPPGATPTRWRFLQRNRVLAALAGATIVVEAGQRSGALNVAGEAHRLGRPVGAVPGPVTSAASAGCHRLLQEGIAKVVTDAHDVLDLIEPSSSASDRALALHGPTRETRRTDDRLSL